MASTTIDTETELSAVNSILGAIGQSPITSLKGSGASANTIVNDNPEVSFIYNLLRDANIDVQNEGWHFNTEKHVNYKANSSTNKITIPADIIKMDVSKGWSHRNYDVVRRNGYLYDKYDHTDEWSDTVSSGIDLDITRLIEFEEVPSGFQRYIIARAATRAATQLVGNPQLTQLLAQQEALTRATVMEYECNQGNHSMFGFPEDSVYTTYQPWTTLRR